MIQGDFSCVVTERGSVRIANLSGAVDADNYDAFVEALSPLIDEKPPLVLLDCKQLEYLNSRSLGYLNQAHRKASANLGKMVLVGVNEKIGSMLVRLGLSQTLIICNDCEEAIALME